MITRRRVIIALGASTIAVPFASLAQQPAKIARIGFFYIGTKQSASDTGRYGAFLQGMRDLGYVEGKNFVLEERFAPDGDYARLAETAADLIRSKVDLIVVTGGTPIRALKEAASTIPVVVTLTTDPIRGGIAASLARPGGNFTGLSAFLEEIFPKHIEFLKLVTPKLSRIGLLTKKDNPGHPQLVSKIEAVSSKIGLQVLRADADAQKDIEPAIGKLVKQRSGAMIILGDSFFVQHFRQIAEITTRHRLPSIYSGAEYPIAGGLMSYGPDFSDNFRRAASYVDKILKGAKPGDLPFEQPTRFYLTVNRKTARALGIAITNELQLRTDKVIE